MTGDVVTGFAGSSEDFFDLDEDNDDFWDGVKGSSLMCVCQPNVAIVSLGRSADRASAPSA